MISVEFVPSISCGTQMGCFDVFGVFSEYRPSVKLGMIHQEQDTKKNYIWEPTFLFQDLLERGEFGEGANISTLGAWDLREIQDKISETVLDS